MRAFTWFEPESLGKASELLARDGGRTRAIAGGMDLLGELKDGLIEADVLVNLKSIKGLDTLRFEEDGSLTIGALVTLAALASHQRVRAEFPAIAQAAESVGSPEIRNTGTVGGNLCQRPRCWYYRSSLHPCLKKGGDTCYTLNGESRYHAILGGGPSYIVHPSDLAPALIACDARVTIEGPEGPHDLPLEQFYVLPSVRLDHETILKPGEIVTRIAVPATFSTARGAGNLFLKFKEKESFDFALASVAAALLLQGQSATGARIVLGGVAPVPWRAAGAEKAITGARVDGAAAGRAAAAAVEGATALDHNAYKIPLTRTLVRRALLELAGGAGRKETGR